MWFWLRGLSTPSHLGRLGPFTMIFKGRREEGAAGERRGTKFQGSRVEGFKHRRIFCLHAGVRAAAGPSLRTHTRRERAFGVPAQGRPEERAHPRSAAQLCCSPLWPPLLWKCPLCFLIVRLQRVGRGRSRTVTHGHAGGNHASLEERASFWRQRRNKTQVSRPPHTPLLMHDSCIARAWLVPVKWWRLTGVKSRCSC